MASNPWREAAARIRNQGDRIPVCATLQVCIYIGEGRKRMAMKVFQSAHIWGRGGGFMLVRAVLGL